jgi:hypothetical protein
VPDQAADDLADLGWIENDSDHFHPASAFGTGHTGSEARECKGRGSRHASRDCRSKDVEGQLGGEVQGRAVLLPTPKYPEEEGALLGA